MWFFIFYRARCVTLEYTLITSDNPPAVHRQDGAKLLVRPVALLTLRLAHISSIGLKSPMGGPWTRSPRRACPRTPLDPLLLHLRTVQHTAIPNKAPHLYRTPESARTFSPSRVQPSGALSSTPSECSLAADTTVAKRNPRPYLRHDSQAFHFVSASGDGESIDLFLRPMS